MTRLQQIVATGAVSAFLIGSSAGAEPTSNGLHLNGLHLNGFRLKGLQLNGFRVHSSLGKSLTFNEIVSKDQGSRVPSILRALAAAPLVEQ